MRNQTWPRSILSLLVVSLTARQALADPPPTYEVEYGIHEVPTDPESPITFRIRLELASSQTSGNSVGWDVTLIEIRQHVNAGQDKLWSESDPAVSTSDGLWWIEHANPASPQMAEFVLPPHIAGTADAADPNAADLIYDVEGKPYTPPPPPQQAPYPITGALDYTFTLVGESEPIGNGEEDPIEIDPPGKT